MKDGCCEHQKAATAIALLAAGSGALIFFANNKSPEQFSRGFRVSGQLEHYLPESTTIDSTQSNTAQKGRTLPSMASRLFLRVSVSPMRELTLHRLTQCNVS
jgi:hypothetical protein